MVGRTARGWRRIITSSGVLLGGTSTPRCSPVVLLATCSRLASGLPAGRLLPLPQPASLPRKPCPAYAPRSAARPALPLRCAAGLPAPLGGGNEPAQCR